MNDGSISQLFHAATPHSHKLIKQCIEHLNTRLVQYSNGQKLPESEMVLFWNGLKQNGNQHH
jgi:hypothetical protein